MNENKLIIYGKNPVLEAVKSGKSINALFVLKDSKGVGEHIFAAKRAGIPVKEVTAERLNAMSEGERHGGVAAELSAVEYCSVEDIVAGVRSPFVLIADEIEDPHNLGALIRTAEAAGADGVIIPKHRSVSVNGAVYAASSGAVAHIKIARVTNLTEAVKKLKTLGLWVYGAETDGVPYTGVTFGGAGGEALVIGSEGRGLSRLVRENCDFILTIPMRGKVNSLNASVSGGILMYHIISQNPEKGGG